MANYIEETTISAQQYVTPTSRYANSKVLYYTENKYITFETYKRPAFSEASSDMFMIIPKGKEYRPDLVSRDFYGTVDYWWRIMEANQMSDILEFKAGANIRLPKNIFF